MSSWEVDITGRGPASPQRAEAILLDEAGRAMRMAAAIMEAEWRRRAERSRRTGTYLRSITSRVYRVGKGWVAVIGTNLRYAIYLERGTGLYGPYHRRIVPVRAQALRWPRGGGQSFSGATGAYTGFRNAPGFRQSGQRRAGAGGASAQYSFARSVRGIQPRRFARDAAAVARPKVQRVVRERGRVAAQRLALEVG